MSCAARVEASRYDVKIARYCLASMPEQTYRPNPNVVATTLEDAESVLLDLETRRYYTLNETGTRIWQLLSEGRPVSDIAVVLTSEFEVSENDARDHARALIDELVEDGLIDKLDT